jgi:hypothetical protein
VDKSESIKRILSMKSNKTLISEINNQISSIILSIEPECDSIHGHTAKSKTINNVVMNLPSGKSIHFGIFVSRNTIIDNLLSLRSSDADSRVAILLDREVDPSIEEAFSRATIKDEFHILFVTDIIDQNQQDEVRTAILNIISTFHKEIIDIEDALLLCRNQVQQEIELFVGAKYYSKLYVERFVIKRAFEKLLNQDISTLLIIASAGKGKTNAICHLVESYLEQGGPCVLLSGKRVIKSDYDIEIHINSLLFHVQQHGVENFHQMLKKIKTHNKPFMVFIDGINENQNPHATDVAIKQIIAQMAPLGIKFCISCRDFSWQYFRDDVWNEFLGINQIESGRSPPKAFEARLGDFSEDEFAEALDLYFGEDGYNIQGTLENEAGRICTNPLLLRFFCEAFSGENVGIVKEIRLSELFEVYLHKKMHNISHELELYTADILERCLAQIALTMMDKGSRYLSINDAERIVSAISGETATKILDKFFDEDVILHLSANWTMEAEINFVYDAFMEFLVARHLSHKWLREGMDTNEKLDEIKRMLEKSEEFDQWLGIIHYLLLFMEEDRDQLKVVIDNLWKSDNEIATLVCCRCLSNLARPTPDDFRLIINHVRNRTFGYDFQGQYGWLEDCSIYAHTLTSIVDRNPNVFETMLINSTQDNDLSVRQVACTSISEFFLRDLEDLMKSLLIGLLSDPSKAVRMTALMAIEEVFEYMPEVFSETDYLSLLSSDWWDVRDHSIKVLMEEFDILPYLVQNSISNMNRDPSTEVRKTYYGVTIRHLANMPIEFSSSILFNSTKEREDSVLEYLLGEIDEKIYEHRVILLTDELWSAQQIQLIIDIVELLKESRFQDVSEYSNRLLPKLQELLSTIHSLPKDYS